MMARRPRRERVDHALPPVECGHLSLKLTDTVEAALPRDVRERSIMEQGATWHSPSVFGALAANLRKISTHGCTICRYRQLPLRRPT
ncbi:hypothetical protein RHRU231_680011 [Rhodococcus ruber]|uniref:Uncharacterized protein n=1 Tax=Rhodococcus ruber TaxID=1830 RepID=A0A098BPU5_9NOCA|nr:hypothetical protein RHRU231_680011 [Rhodococcus ruber]